MLAYRHHHHHPNLAPLFECGIPSPQEALCSWQKKIYMVSQHSDTVDGSEIRRAPVDMVKVSHSLRRLLYMPGGCCWIFVHQLQFLASCRNSWDSKAPNWLLEWLRHDLVKNQRLWTEHKWTPLMTTINLYTWRKTKHSCFFPNKNSAADQKPVRLWLPPEGCLIDPQNVCPILNIPLLKKAPQQKICRFFCCEKGSATAQANGERRVTAPGLTMAPSLDQGTGPGTDDGFYAKRSLPKMTAGSPRKKKKWRIFGPSTGFLGRKWLRLVVCIIYTLPKFCMVHQKSRDGNSKFGISEFLGGCPFSGTKSWSTPVLCWKRTKRQKPRPENSFGWDLIPKNKSKKLHARGGKTLEFSAKAGSLFWNIWPPRFDEEKSCNSNLTLIPKPEAECKGILRIFPWPRKKKPGEFPNSTRHPIRRPQLHSYLKALSRSVCQPLPQDGR